MIIVIDILIISMITLLSIYNSFNKKLTNEILKLGSLIIALVITNITPINTKIAQILKEGVISMLQINNSFNSEIFNPISFLLTFLIFYIIILSINKTLKNHIKDFSKTKSIFFHKMLIVFFSTIRMTLIMSLLVYSLESSIFYPKSIQKKIHTSPSLKAFSSFSNSIINN